LSDRLPRSDSADRTAGDDTPSFSPHSFVPLRMICALFTILPLVAVCFPSFIYYLSPLTLVFRYLYSYPSPFLSELRYGRLNFNGNNTSEICNAMEGSTRGRDGGNASVGLGDRW
jgi:hypothetical protein